MEQVVAFMQFITARDRSKWYTFSIFDLFLFVVSGLDWITTGDSCIGFWLFIIAFNAVVTWAYNNPRK